MKKFQIFFLIAALSVILLTQYKLVMPFVYKVVASDIFLVDSKDKADQLPISNKLTGLAFAHCNNQIKKTLGDDGVNASFPAKPINSWSMGNYRYIINGEVNITDGNNGVKTKKYACRISYKNGESEEGADNFDNWDIEGLSGITP